MGTEACPRSCAQVSCLIFCSVFLTSSFPATQWLGPCKGLPAGLAGHPSHILPHVGSPGSQDSLTGTWCGVPCSPALFQSRGDGPRAQTPKAGSAPAGRHRGASWGHRAGWPQACTLSSRPAWAGGRPRASSLTSPGFLLCKQGQINNNKC